MTLDLAQIRAADDLGAVTEQVPEWGGDVRIRQLPAKTMLSFIDRVSKNGDAPDKDDYGFLFDVLAMTLVDDDDQPIFETGAQAAEVLGDKSLKVVNRVAQKAIEINRLTDRDIEAGKAD